MFQDANDIPSTSTAGQSQKEAEPEPEEVMEGSVRVIKVARRVCERHLREHIEYLEAELERRMDIIEEEANGGCQGDL